MIEREITDRLTALFRQYPFVTVTGPRQSGKTTLCRAAFPDLKYASLEEPDQREFAETDPRGFLSQLGEEAIIDEIQHVPSLLSYLQVLADERGLNSMFVLTGSEQFPLSDAISQSLAGRTALLRLLPFSLIERQRAGASEAMEDIIYSGFYPRILHQKLEPRQALGDYFETYVQRDVRRLSEIRNLSAFSRFVRLCAGRVGQLVNLSSLGADAGVSHTTAREWLTVLEASYIIFQLGPFHANIRKRLVKSPKLYFYDVGLASYLLGIENAAQVATHPLRGQLFENVVVAEVVKHCYNRNRRPNISFFRDSRGLECDLFYETDRGIHAIEAKSGSTIASDYFNSINRVAKLVPGILAKTVVYGGTARQTRSDCEAIPLTKLGDLLEEFDSRPPTANIEVRRSGEPLDSVDVLALFPNGTWKRATTDIHGDARLELHTMHLPMTVFVAAEGCTAYVEGEWIPAERALTIEIGTLPGGGSVVFAESTGHIPGLSGRLNPILDTSNRTYLYARNIAINEGEQQPVSFVPGEEEMRLTDSDGNEFLVRVVEISGQSALLEYRLA